MRKILKNKQKETFCRLLLRFDFSCDKWRYTILIAVMFAPVRFTLSPETL